MPSRRRAGPQRLIAAAVLAGGPTAVVEPRVGGLVQGSCAVTAAPRGSPAPPRLDHEGARLKRIINRLASFGITLALIRCQNDAIMVPCNWTVSGTAPGPAEPGRRGREGKEVRAAQRLIATLDDSVRLMLLDVLAAAAADVTRELAPGSVELRLRGSEPEFA